ncbi:MAG: fibronectin type III domain-containing protein, partial [Candidatus Marinimicrobia bacterium]|nr:fibronectin type III domain-containing protein [Candidatus Neomarinimicrobiota bacterium]
MKRIISIISLLILINTCENLERKNPVDSNVDIIAPTNLQLSQQNIYTVLLSWSFSGDKYDGFIIDRKIGSDSWQIAYDTVTCEIRSYTDTSAVPTESHNYRIYAYADENQSSAISKDITLIFPAPENLQLTQLSDTTVALQWQDKSDGEDGFIINRKKGSGSWETEIKKTTTTTWMDSTVSPGSTYSYQVKAF